MTADPRKAAAATIEQWLKTGLFPERLLGQAREHRAVVRELVYGVVRRKRTLEWVLGRYAKKQPSPATTASLLIGLYELLFMDSVPDHAAINEAVARIKASRDHRAAPFANAVLRNAQRDAETLRRDLEHADTGVRRSHPDLLVTRWRRQFGKAATDALCAWNNSIPDLVIHVNTLRTTHDDLAAALCSADIEAVPHPHAPKDCFVIPHGIRVAKLPGYRQGFFCVRDPATTHAVDLLDPQPGDWVLDACAAPGGKTLLIAERMHDRGCITATDSVPERLDRLRRNATRMGLSCIMPLVADATDPLALAGLSEHGCFDRILLDVPCTNTGVLRRRVDARWRFSETTLAEATRVQRTILDAAVQVLAPGGALVYSTCSLEPEENQFLIDAWLKTHHDFRQTDVVSLFPPDSGTDGMYSARLERE